MTINGSQILLGGKEFYSKCVCGGVRWDLFKQLGGNVVRTYVAYDEAFNWSQYLGIYVIAGIWVQSDPKAVSFSASNC